MTMMDYALLLAVIAIIVSILLTYWRTVSGAKQRLILEQQLQKQKEQISLLRQLVGSFNRLTESYDRELETMRNQLLLSSPTDTEGPVDEATRAAEIELERERQKAEKKRQKEETKRIKKMMKALEKGEG